MVRKLIRFGFAGIVSLGISAAAPVVLADDNPPAGRGRQGGDGCDARTRLAQAGDMGDKASDATKNAADKTDDAAKNAGDATQDAAKKARQLDRATPPRTPGQKTDDAYRGAVRPAD